MAHLRQRQSDREESLCWAHILSAVKHEMYPMMAAAIGKCVDELSSNDLSDDAVEAVLAELKKKRALSNGEVHCRKGLIQRARQFSWTAQPTLKS